MFRKQIQPAALWSVLIKNNDLIRTSVCDFFFYLPGQSNFLNKKKEIPIIFSMSNLD